MSEDRACAFSNKVLVMDAARKLREIDVLSAPIFRSDAPEVEIMRFHSMPLWLQNIQECRFVSDRGRALLGVSDTLASSTILTSSGGS